MFTNKFQIKTAKLTRLKITGKFGCTVSVFIVSVVIIVRLFGSFASIFSFSASPSSNMNGCIFYDCHNPTPNRTAYPAEKEGYVLRADMPRQIIAIPLLK